MFPTFRFGELLASPPARRIASRNEAQQRTPHAGPPLVRLLVVDGDSSTRDSLDAHFGRRYRVDWAATSHEGAQMLRTHSADLVVLETRLPDGSGLALLSAIGTETPGVPVVIVTADGSEDVCASALRLGARDYFRKPLNPVLVSSAVRRLLRTSHMARASAARRAAQMGMRSPEAGRSDLRVEQAIKYIDGHSRDSVTLSGLGRLVGMNRFALSRAMSARGVPFRMQLLRRRVRDAQVALAETTIPMFDVAAMSGFGDISRFNKVFRKYAGMTPTAYRASAGAKSAH
jgi:YesN/AraC family two-component response regulator